MDHNATVKLATDLPAMELTVKVCLLLHSSISHDYGLHCVDYNECSTPNICQQLCVNTKGNYECHCTEGYYADMKTGTCMAEGTVMM